MQLGAQAATAGISREEAKDIALDDAGLTENDILYSNAKKGTENGAAVYEVEFDTNAKEYDYDIAIADGEIVTMSMETSRPTASGAAVSEAKAKSIALKDAGLTENEVTFTSVRSDHEDGVAVFEIKFETGEKTYEYDIAKAGGKIVNFSWEVKTPACVAAKQAARSKQTAAKSAKTGREAAIEAALNHAGLTEGEVNRIRCEKDYDDGREIYDVEFHKGNYEYNYDIDASTFRVLDWDRDYDD